MTYPRPRYSAQDKEIFWIRLQKYRDALASETSGNIITTSLAIHSALANVPKSYKRHVTYVFNHTVRGKPLSG